MHQIYLKHTCTYTSVIKNAKLIEARIKLKLFSVLDLMKQLALLTDIFQVYSLKLLYDTSNRWTRHGTPIEGEGSVQLTPFY
jgi:hypothetical protein